LSEGAAAAVALVAAAALGSVPSGWFLVRRAVGEDLRRTGSGSTGATNAFRRAGVAWGLATLTADASKGALAVGLAKGLDAPPWTPAAAIVVAVAAHAWNPWLRFRGGRGVATAAGGMTVLAPWPTAAAAAVFLALLVATRRISVGSLAAALALPLAAALRSEPRTTILAAAAASIVVAVRHRENLARLRAGTEPRLGSGGGR
jgi:glycerol-3-phosphate acyltransferase PlsY